MSDRTTSVPLPADLFDRPDCAGGLVPFRVGDKWTGVVLRCLEDGPRRFSELRVPLHWITPKVLTETLRAMERDGFLTRTAYDENPPRVEYELTALGRSLIDPLNATCEWSRAHLTEVTDAREQYTAR
ncbi:helix-turn-helix domain-containing protein [Streptomyces sp. BPTC-684]|uniref:winged helix-turn-helix transcriptional regulator n=1 Tax=Streptomyces sp. BPTC-684 TaxID=3043734 RepID=UPI0024B0A727|nr:helix-turn-helix domain-containing protein [Streptomyces sp. BPTC-684]WHM40373.1 helix-turn-helix domain-containing protein [Streptomyces sp. BPTC-684]